MGRSSLSRTVLWSLIALTVQSAAARAQSAGAELARMLEVEPSADRCIEATALTARVGRWLTRRPKPGELTIAVDAGAEPLSFTLSRDGRVVAQRTFGLLPERCEDRLDAVALAIAVAIDHAVGAARAPAQPSEPGVQREPEAPPPSPATPDRPTDAPQPEPAPKSTAAQTDGAPEPGEAPVAASASPRVAPELALLFGAGLLVETLPAPALALEAGVELATGRLRFALAALVAPDREVALGGGNADLDLLGARAHACLTDAAAGFALEGCAGGALGAVLASGRGYEMNERATMAWTAALLRVALRYPENNPVSARIAIDGLAHAVRPRIAARSPAGDAETAPAPLGLAASLELLIALP